MPERDGYIPGVPCWVDTSHPDPDAAGGEVVAQLVDENQHPDHKNESK